MLDIVQYIGDNLFIEGINYIKQAHTVVPVNGNLYIYQYYKYAIKIVLTFNKLLDFLHIAI